MSSHNSLGHGSGRHLLRIVNPLRVLESCRVKISSSLGDTAKLSQRVFIDGRSGVLTVVSADPGQLFSPTPML